MLNWDIAIIMINFSFEIISSRAGETHLAQETNKLERNRKRRTKKQKYKTSEVREEKQQSQQFYVYISHKNKKEQS